jgi:hypothetical protein
MTETLEDIGEIKYKRNKRAKRLYIYVRPLKPVEVTVPSLVSMREARKMVMDHKPWILDQKEKIRKSEENSRILKNGGTIHIKDWEIEVLQGKLKEPKIKRSGHKVTVTLASGQEPGSSETEPLVHKAMEAVMRHWVKTRVVPFTFQEARKRNIPINRVSVRKSTTRWGSFSSQNNISLSLYLASLPNHLIEYVVMHELAHYEVRDHSRRFWDHLATFIENPRQLDRELKKYRTGVF